MRSGAPASVHAASPCTHVHQHARTHTHVLTECALEGVLGLSYQKPYWLIQGFNYYSSFSAGVILF